VVLVDDLAAGRADGRQRWEEVDRLLEAGIDVVATLDIAAIASLADLVSGAAGTARPRPGTVSDEWLRRADQIQLVDITPEAMRRRIAHGNAFAPDELDADTVELFAGRGFATLRALMLSWMADRLADVPDDPPGATERVVVAITGAPAADVVVRRAARLAQRTRGRLIGVHVRAPLRRGLRDRLSGRRIDARADADLADRRELLADLGGSYHEVAARNVAEALVAVAEAESATQLVIGTAAPSRPGGLLGRSVVGHVLQRARRFDVHVISHPSGDPAHRRRSARRDSPLSRRRQLAALALAFVMLSGLTAVLAAMRDTVDLSTALIIYLLAVVGVAAVGGPRPGVAAAVAAPLLANWFLVPPLHTLQVADGEHLVSLFVFVSVALVVSTFVSIAAQRTIDAARARDEATTLATLAGTTGADPLAAITEQLRLSFGLDGVALLRDGPGTTGTPVIEAVAGRMPTSSRDAILHERITEGVSLIATGRALSTDDHRVLRVFVQQLARALDQLRLAEAAARAEVLDQTDELRTALLRAVSHDLRTPLAGIKASVSSLRQTDVEWPDDVRDEFLETIEDETDRLASIVTNLLDLGRLQSGALRPNLRAASTEEVVAAALDSLGRPGEDVTVDLPVDLPEVHADPAMLERVVANLVGNAAGFSPVGAPPRVEAHVHGVTVQVQVIDHGPGIHPRDRATVLRPFHRLDDATSLGGLGLGLAIADGLTRAMGGTLTLRDTPGGGLTAVVTLPCASPHHDPAPPGAATAELR
jgi:two-component system sensor histidine kinase KdpD